MTNGDAVRHMTNEELAEWCWTMLRHLSGYTSSRAALLNWLKAKADWETPFGEYSELLERYKRERAEGRE